MNRDIIYNYLDEIITNPHCELNYSKDYELLIAVMLSAQTTDKRVNEVTKILFSKYSSLEELSSAKFDDVYNITKSLGFGKKALNTILIAKQLKERFGGIVPSSRDDLESLPGVGRKTANVILMELFHLPVIAVDTHVSRVAIRLGFAKDNDNPLIIEEKLMKKIPKERISKIHHQFLLFGRYYCKSINPNCNSCKLKEVCKYYKKKKI